MPTRPGKGADAVWNIEVTSNDINTSIVQHSLVIRDRHHHHHHQSVPQNQNQDQDPGRGIDPLIARARKRHMNKTPGIVLSICVSMWYGVGVRAGYATAFSALPPNSGINPTLLFRSVSRNRAAISRCRSLSSWTDFGIVPRIRVSDATEPSDEPVLVKGWVRTVRKQKLLTFLQINDGSNLRGIQCVASLDKIDNQTKDRK